MLVASIDSDRRFQGLRNAEGHYGTESFISAPLLNGDELLGVINLTDKLTLKPFDEADLGLLVGLSGRAAAPLARLLKAERERWQASSLADKIESARAQLEQATRQLEQIRSFNESILHCVPLPVVTFDRSLRPRFLNEAAKRVLGDDVGSLLKLPVTLKEGLWAAVLPATVEDGRSMSFDEATFTPPGGMPRTVKIVISPTCDDGVPVGGLMVVEDIDDRVRLEKQLSQAERLAAIGKLAASVAHELNNPIDGVLRYIGLALKLESGNPRLVRYLEECRYGLQRMARIVTSLLEYSRSNRQAERMQPVSGMVAAALKLLEPRRQKTGVQVRVELGEGMDASARECLLQCFVNVARNALDAMAQGGVLTVRGQREGGEAIVSFIDTGPGIPKQIIGRIFDPFFTTKGAAEGTGLGLAVSRDLTAQCGGHLEAVSTPDQGATFRFRFPVA